MMFDTIQFLSMEGKLRRLLLIAAALAVIGVAVPPAQAALQVRVDQGVTEPIPLAIPDFIASPQGRDIATVVRADL
jgi:TolB protein